MAMVIPKGSVCMKKAGICTIVILVFAALAVWIYRSGNHDEKTPVQRVLYEDHNLIIAIE